MNLKSILTLAIASAVASGIPAAADDFDLGSQRSEKTEVNPVTKWTTMA